MGCRKHDPAMIFKKDFVNNERTKVETPLGLTMVNCSITSVDAIFLPVAKCRGVSSYGNDVENAAFGLALSKSSTTSVGGLWLLQERNMAMMRTKRGDPTFWIHIIRCSLIVFLSFYPNNSHIPTRKMKHRSPIWVYFLWSFSTCVVLQVLW